MFNFFPFTNFHALNADWLIKKVQETTDTINTSIEDLEERVNALYRRLQTIGTDIDGINSTIESMDERINALFRRLGTLATALDNKAALPIIINLSADGFPAQVPADAQTQVQAALSALQTGTGAAQVHIEQQVDPVLPAVFNLQLDYAGDGILTGIMSKTVFNGTTQEYGMRITAVSINTNTMMWEMGSQDLPQIST